MTASKSDLNYKEYTGGAQPAGPPLVLVHGAGGDLMHWPTDLRRLPGRRVYAVDLPGHGKTGGAAFDDIAAYAEALKAWVDPLDLPACVLVGHSMGGAIAIEFALRYAGRLAGLILVGTGARLRVAPQFLAGITSDYDTTIDALIRGMYGDRADANLVRLGRRRLRETPREVLRADFAACDAFDRRSDVGSITLPTLIICGDADAMTPPKLSQYLHGQIVGSELVVLPGAGHMVALQQPQAVAEHVQRFMERIASA